MILWRYERKINFDARLVQYIIDSGTYDLDCWWAFPLTIVFEILRGDSDRGPDHAFAMRGYFKHLWPAMLMAATVGLKMGVLQATNAATAAQLRFFAICGALSVDLQPLLCGAVFGIRKTVIADLELKQAAWAMWHE